MDSILIIGGHGLLGAKIAEQAGKSGDWEVHITKHGADDAEGHALEVSDFDSAEKLLTELRPDAVVNTAAFHNVDACEREKDRATLINSAAPAKIAEMCKDAGAHYTFISTDYVFDGLKEGPYLPADEPNPQGFYARSKLEGERSVLRVSSAFAAARMSVIYGWNRRKTNFVTWMLGELRAGREVRVAMDQKSTPTLADNGAEAILRIAKLRKPGIWHTTGKECLQRYDFAKIAAEVFGFDKALIKPVPTSALNQLAKRPANSCLDVGKTERELGVRMLTAREGLTLMKKQLEESGGEIVIPTKHK